MQIVKTLKVKKPEFQDNFANKILIFKVKLEDNKINSITGVLECDFIGGFRGQIKLDWEIEMYKEKFSKQFSELISSTKKTMTVKCVFN